jgi:hypothetical protein
LKIIFREKFKIEYLNLFNLVKYLYLLCSKIENQVCCGTLTATTTEHPFCSACSYYKEREGWGRLYSYYSCKSSSMMECLSDRLVVSVFSLESPSTTRGKPCNTQFIENVVFKSLGVRYSAVCVFMLYRFRACSN